MDIKNKMINSNDNNTETKFHPAMGREGQINDLSLCQNAPLDADHRWK